MEDPTNLSNGVVREALFLTFVTVSKAEINEATRSKAFEKFNDNGSHILILLECYEFHAHDYLLYL